MLPNQFNGIQNLLDALRLTYKTIPGSTFTKIVAIFILKGPPKYKGNHGKNAMEASANYREEIIGEKIENN